MFKANHVYVDVQDNILIRFVDMNEELGMYFFEEVDNEVPKLRVYMGFELKNIVGY